VPSLLLQDTLVLRTSIGSGINNIGDLRFTSFDERFAGDRDTKKSFAETGYRLASLEVPVGPNVLVDAGAVFAASSGGMVFANRSDSFAERFAGTGPIVNLASLVRPPESSIRPEESSWVVQLIGDDTEATALSRFRKLQSKHESILGNYKPIVVNTALTPGSPSIWTRVRVGLNSRQAANSLCAQLESAGERCVVQRNTSASSSSWKEIEAAKAAPPSDQHREHLPPIT
jgi:hypothetical protein